VNGDWFKSSFSAHNGSCVEMRKTDDGAEVRDSKDRGGPVLVFTHAEWETFLAGVRAEV
jgi:hypothetical protein